MVAYGPISGSMLTSAADRDRAVEVLRTGFVEGRLTQEEFTERVAGVHASRTYDQLAELTSDLPAGEALDGYPPAGSSERHQPLWQGVSAAGLTLTSVIIFALAALVTALALVLDAPSVQISPATVVRPAPGMAQATPHVTMMPILRKGPSR
ncbi:MAG TPA: DUF1707 domain-containing protein [Streptosporangiaceae bacterium]|nr:DUF1707 domain-containing protein [Streptosporangiaceae bacterium]